MRHTPQSNRASNSTVHNSLNAQDRTFRKRQRGFTLIELLVVVSIIALLISILMPSLKAAKDQSKAVICQSNIKHLGFASHLYAQDHMDEIFPSSVDGSSNIPSIGGAWARLPGPNNGVLPGLLHKYVSNMDKIAECPTNKRAADVNLKEKNMFGGDTDLDFDYTMAGNTHGARLDRRIEMAYLTDPSSYGNWTLPPEIIAAEKLTVMNGLAIFLEEHTTFYNQESDDGLWSNADQITTRHRGAGNLAFLDGHVEFFHSPTGQWDKTEETADQCANDFYVRKQGTTTWFRLERQIGLFREYGWINNPKKK